jgi:multidrug efflux system membrane fusion protein
MTCKKRNFLLGLVIAVLLALSLAWYFHTHASNTAADKKKPLPRVLLAQAHTAAVPVYLSALGAVTAAQNVTVRTQINGRLLHVFFQEGQMVKAGDPLAEIDSQAYQAQRMQFQGQLARDQALLANARNDLTRYKTLYPQGGASKQTYDTQISLVKQLEGTVKADEGQVASAQVNIDYCHIQSPIDGRVGLRLVDPGNFVQTSDPNGLAVINTIQPITVLFSLPEDNVPQLISSTTEGKMPTVLAFDRTQNKQLAIGQLLSMDNQIDPMTGTIKLKAQFENKDNHLFPNQFVNIKLLLRTLPQATLIPTAAIFHGTKGPFVYVLRSDKTVHVQAVTLGTTSGNDTVILSGIAPNQSVVTEGGDKLNEGMRVGVIGSPPGKK